MQLSGKRSSPHNGLYLTGQCEEITASLPKINAFKKRILRDYLLPLYSEQWDILHQNKLLMPDLIDTLQRYFRLYKLPEFQLYIELLKMLKIVLEQTDILNEFERKQHLSKEKNTILNMVYKTTRIQLLPEYEIYHLFLGKPDWSGKKETYREEVLCDIRRLMKKEDIQLETIKQYILG
jgi:hypothetical protein